MDNDEWLQEFVDSASEIDEEDLRDMDAENQVIDQTIEPESTTQTQPVDTTSKEVEPKQEEGNALKTGAEVALAIPTGTVDWGIGLVNTIIPGERLDIPNIPRFENDVTQSIRDIASVVVPTIFITRGLGGVATKAHAAKNWKLGNDAFFKWFAKTGLAGGSGVIADAIAPVQERDHNALGMIKKAFPQSTGWISDDLATLDDDEPDIKRQKNIKEGLGLGFFADVLVSTGRLAKSLKGVNRATQWVPENEKASVVLEKIRNPEKLSSDPLEDAALKSAKRRSDDLD